MVLCRTADDCRGSWYINYGKSGPYPGPALYNSAGFQFAPGSAVADLNGVAGQGQANPKSLFESHAMFFFAGTLYDPSYGRLYVTPELTLDADVASFAKNAIASEAYDYMANAPGGGIRTVLMVYKPPAGVAMPIISPFRKPY